MKRLLHTKEIPFSYKLFQRFYCNKFPPLRALISI